MNPNPANPPVVAAASDAPPHGIVDLDIALPNGQALPEALYFRVEWTTDVAHYQDAAARTPDTFYPSDPTDGFERSYVQQIDVTPPPALWRAWTAVSSIRRIYVRVGAGPRADVTDPAWQWSRTPTEILVNHDPVATLRGPGVVSLDARGAVFEDLVIDASMSKDPDAGTRLSYVWSLISAPPGATTTSPELENLLSRIADGGERVTLVPAGSVVAASNRGSYTVGVSLTDDDEPSHFSGARGRDAARVTFRIGACPLCIVEPVAGAPRRIDRFGRSGARTPRDVEIRWEFDDDHHAALEAELGTISVTLTIYRQDLRVAGAPRTAVFQHHDQPAGITGRVVWPFVDNVSEFRWTGDQVPPGVYDIELQVSRNRDNTFVPPEVVQELGAIRLDDFAAWADLMSFRPSLLTQIALSQRLDDRRPYHPIEDGYGDINLDSYPVRVTRLPRIAGSELTPEQLFRTMRLNIDDFFVGSHVDLVAFQPTDQALWESDTPVGAVLIYEISADSGAVQCTLSEPRRFRFSTIPLTRFPQIGPFTHPVSGNREWGIVGDDDGGYTIYARGADRITTLLSAGLSFAVFSGAHDLWTTWQRRTVEYINANGGQAELVDPVSTRESWDVIREAYYRPVTPWVWEVVR